MFSSKITTRCLMGVAVEPPPWCAGESACAGATPPASMRAAAPATAPQRAVRPRGTALLPLSVPLVVLMLSHPPLRARRTRALWKPCTLSNAIVDVDRDMPTAHWWRPGEQRVSKSLGTLDSPFTRSGQQGAPEPVRAVADARECEEVAAPEGGDVVHQGLSREPLLHGLELPLQVLLVAGEEQPHVE